MLYTLIGVILLVLTFKNTRLIKGLDAAVRDTFAPIEKGNSWAARLGARLLRNYVAAAFVGFALLGALMILFMWLSG